MFSQKLFTRHAKKLQARDKIPGLAIVIITPDSPQPTFITLGHESLSSKNKVTPKSTFALGSLSKAFAGYLLQKLAESGKCSLDDKISDHDPLWKKSSLDNSVTIRSLLNHTSGIPQHYFTQLIDMSHDDSELLSLFYHMPPKLLKRGQFRYTNIAYLVLGKLIGKLSGKPWQEYLQVCLTELNMPSTHLGQQSHDVSGHSEKNKKTIESRSVSGYTTHQLAGSVFCSIKDYASWLQFLLSDATTAKSIEREVDKSENHYSHGWWIADKKMETRCHTGSVVGFSTSAAFLPDQGIGICVLCNKGESYAAQELVSDFIRDMTDDARFDINDGVISKPNTEEIEFEPKYFETLTTETLSTFTGTYSSPLLSELTISLAPCKRKLLISIDKLGATGELTPVSKTCARGDTELFNEHTPFQIIWHGEFETAASEFYVNNYIGLNEHGSLRLIAPYLSNQVLEAHKSPKATVLHLRRSVRLQNKARERSHASSTARSERARQSLR